MTEYITPANLEEALARLTPDATVIAGGTDLMIRVRRARLQGKEPPRTFLDVSGLRELNRLETDGDRPFIGAAVTFRRLETDAAVGRKLPLLSQAAATVGSVQVRTLATIGGNVANASPAADGVTALAALGAKAEIASPKGARFVLLEELITGPNSVSLDPGELIVGFNLDRMRKDSCQRFYKVGRRQTGIIARLNLAVSLDKALKEPRVVLGACFPSPRRLVDVEELLASGTPGSALWKQAGKIAADCFVNACGRRASAPYKIPAISRLVAGALESAWKETGVVQ